jgi:hypothetical protein
MTEVYTDFAASGLCNTAVRPDGVIELARSDEYRGMDEKALGTGNCSWSGPVAARNSRGQFIVFWAEYSRAYVQMYEADWREACSRIEVSTTDWPMGQLAIAIRPDDRFVVAWSQSIYADFTRGDFDIFMQCFDPNFSKSGPVFDVTAKPGYQFQRSHRHDMG